MLGSLVLIWVFIFLLFLFVRNQRPKNFPPGPRPVPLFGNLFQLNITNPLKDFEKLAERYGNVYSLYIGGTPAVVLTGLKAVKEAFVTKAADFSGRPQNLLTSHASEGKGIVFIDYGAAWKEHRRFALMTLRNFGMGKQSMEDRILGETEHLIYDALPILRALPLPFRKVIINLEVLKKMIASMISKHKTSRVPGEPENFVDCYLDELDKAMRSFQQRGNDGSFNEEQLARYIVDLHAAATDTTSNTFLTAFLYLITHPDIHERCQKEIDEVLEGKAQASFEDRHKMPYTQAVMHESQRIANTVPLGVFHCASRDTELMGYSIPKDTVIISNLASVLSEEGQWKFPHEFNPANFLNEQGQFEKPEAFLPFSTGLCSEQCKYTE
ncbi:hypothetical protein AOLI_G00057540 [Acnodon oligacanthus]